MKRILLVAAAMSVGCTAADPSSDAAPVERAPTAVRTEPLTDAGSIERIEAPGRLERSAERTLAFRAGGYVAALEVDVGDRVGAGTVLARLDALDVEAGRAAAQTEADRADRTAARMERLHRDSVVPLAQLEDARDAALRARAALDAAEDAAQRIVLRAPTAGRVSARMVERDEWVGPGDPIVRLSAGSTWTVDVALTDRDALRIRVGTPARATSDALPGRLFTGTVTRVGGGADPRTGTFPIEVTLDPTDVDLRSGLVVRVELQPGGADENALTAPPEALVEADAGRGTVFVIRADTARAQSVDVLGVASDGVRIRSDALAPGTSVVTTGAAYLRDGEPVRVIPATPGSDR